MIAEPETGGGYPLCTRDRNNIQEPESETKDRKQETEHKSDQEGTMKEINNPRTITRWSIPKMANSTRVQ